MPPNVLIVQTDEHVFRHLGFNGHPVVRTPHLDRLAAEGAVFDNAYACNGVCVPSRASLLTGRYTIAHGVANNHIRLPASEATMPRLFGAAGYATGFFGKTHWGGDDSDMAGQGWGESFIWHKQYNDYLSEQGIDARYPEGREIRRPDIRYWSVGTSRIPTEHYFENVMADRAADFISRNKDQPFLCWVSNVAPHGPFSPPPPFDAMYDPADAVLAPRFEGELDGRSPAFARWATQNRKYMTDDELRIHQAATYGLITLVDDNVGKLVAALKNADLYDDTVIVFTTDHGDFGGRYGIIGKSWCQIDDIMRIPLVFKAPGGAAGQRFPCLAQNVDVLPTLMDYAGAQAPDKMQGVSLRPVIEGRAESVRDAAFAYDQAEYTGDHLYQSMIRKGQWKLVQPGRDPAELYDMENDPWETRNVAGDPANREALRELQEALLRWHVENSGGFYAKETARFWEDETAFYDETQFGGGRIHKRGDAPV